MELRQLQYFVSIVDNNSFSKAAEENYISQSAISQQIFSNPEYKCAKNILIKILW